VPVDNETTRSLSAARRLDFGYTDAPERACGGLKWDQMQKFDPGRTWRLVYHTAPRRQKKDQLSITRGVLW
jgi:hypothetical protein